MPPSTTAEQIKPCWKHVGIWGDKTCPELVAHTHCRNCLVFGEAAAQLLERPLPDGYREEWALRLAQAPMKRVTAGGESIVIFRLGTEWLGLKTTLFLEVVERRPVHSLPHREGGILEGVTNVRGELLICVSLSRLFGIEERQVAGGAKRLLVVKHAGGRLVFPAEEVYAGCRFLKEDVAPIPATLALAAAPFVAGIIQWNDYSVGLLNEEALFQAIEERLA